MSSHGYTWRVAGPILWAIALADLVKGVRKITPLYTSDRRKIPTPGRFFGQEGRKNTSYKVWKRYCGPVVGEGAI